MAIVDDGIQIWPFSIPSVVNGTITFSSTDLAIDGADEKAGHMFRAPRTGSIDAIGWATRTVTTGATVDVRLETISSGFPSGTLKGTNTNGSQVVADGDDNKCFLTTLTSAASVTKGDKLAVVIVNPGSSYGTMQIACVTDDYQLRFPRTALCSGASPAWANTAIGAPVGFVRYTDSPIYVPIPHYWPFATALTSVSISTSTTPDVAGAYFRLPISRRLRGAYVVQDLDAEVNLRCVTTAYHQANGTGIVATANLLADDDTSWSGAGLAYYEFVESPTLSANTWYRLIYEPASTTQCTLQKFDVYSSDLLKAYSSTGDFYYTSAKDPTQDSDWTNTNTEVPFIWLVFDGTDSGSAAGGGFPILGGSIVRG